MSLLFEFFLCFGVDICTILVYNYHCELENATYRLLKLAHRHRRIGDLMPSGKASFHSIRGTAITWFKDHGVTGEDLRSITGHTSDAMEDIYARPMANIARIAQDFKEGKRQ